MMNIDYPLRIDARGRAAQTDDEEHIRDLIEQVLFTSPGERLNRPDFGCGLRQLVFAPAGDELATATQFLIQGSLQKWLGALIEVAGVDVQFDEQQAALHVKVTYKIIRNQKPVVAKFRRPVP